jgi:serine/threonine protein kinase
MALKIIDMERTTDKDEVMKKLNSELRASIELANKTPFLVKVVEYFVDSGCCFLVMDYFPGGDLAKVLKKNKEQGIKMPRVVLQYYYLLLKIILYGEIINNFSIGKDMYVLFFFNRNF